MLSVMKAACARRHFRLMPKPIAATGSATGQMAAEVPEEDATNLYIFVNHGRQDVDASIFKILLDIFRADFFRSFFKPYHLNLL